MCDESGREAEFVAQTLSFSATPCFDLFGHCTVVRVVAVNSYGAFEPLNRFNPLLMLRFHNWSLRVR